ncbi:MAG: glutamate--tRNA ligase family protein, partial [Pseudomonadota bacterium]
MTDKQPSSSPRHSSLGPRPFFYRGRFAPSPTGPLHFGSLVAAVGSYLQARHQGGQWWLRIEDIDPPREVAGAAGAIIALLAAYGFEWDELSYQSRRQAYYAEALAQLQHQHLTYPCTCTRRQLREHPIGCDGTRIYSGTCRSRRFPCRDRHATRLLTTDTLIKFADRLQGKQICELEKAVGDFVLRRADGYISYQDFVNKVKAMEINAPNNEVMSIAKVIDDKNSGYIDFRQFMQYFTPNLPEITDEGTYYNKRKQLLGSVNGSAVPSTEMVKNQINRCKSTKQELMNVTNS